MGQEVGHGRLEKRQVRARIEPKPDVMVPPKTLPALGVSVPSVLGCDGEAMCPEVVSRLSTSLRKEGLLTV